MTLSGWFYNQDGVCLLSGTNLRFEYNSDTSRPLIAEGFNPEPIHMRFVVYKMAPGQGFLQALRFSAVSIIPLFLYAHLHLHAALKRRINEIRVRNFRDKVLAETGV
jgi:hypothetical protein